MISWKRLFTGIGSQPHGKETILASSPDREWKEVPITDLFAEYGGGGGSLESPDQIVIHSGTSIIIQSPNQSGDIQVNDGVFQVDIPTGASVDVVSSAGLIFRIAEDGSLHGLTGKSLVFDL